MSLQQLVVLTDRKKKGPLVVFVTFFIVYILSVPTVGSYWGCIPHHRSKYWNGNCQHKSPFFTIDFSLMILFLNFKFISLIFFNTRTCRTTNPQFVRFIRRCFSALHLSTSWFHREVTNELYLIEISLW